MTPNVLDAAAGVCGLIMLGGLASAFWPERTDLTRSAVLPTPTPHALPNPASLAGDLTIRVWSKEGGTKRGLTPPPQEGTRSERGALAVLAAAARDETCRQQQNRGGSAGPPFRQPTLTRPAGILSPSG
jgi:hypothetical protein